MLEETYRCDGPGCKNQTPKKNPGPGWKVVKWLLGHANPDITTADRREWHYCSTRCLRNTEQ